MTINCPICNSGRIRHFAETEDLFYETTDERFSYKRCQDCQTIFLASPPSPAQMSKYYPSIYGPHRADPNTPMAMHTFAGRLVEKGHAFLCSLYPFHTRRQKFFSTMTSQHLFVDYGCGGGESLDRAKRQGARTFGIDFAESILGALQSRGHQAMLAHEDWAAAVETSGGADRIRMNHSLEHVHEPLEVLRLLGRIARPACETHISVPNPRGVSALCFGASWMGLEPPRHLNIMPANKISEALREQGFDIISICTEPTAKDFARSLGILGWRRGMLRTKSSIRTFDTRAWALLSGMPLSLSAPLFGKGDRIHIFAKKRTRP